MSTPTTITPALPKLTTMVTRIHGRFVLEVLDNGQNLQQFTLNTQPSVQMRDIDGDGIADLVINIKQRKKLVVFAAFSGVTAQQIR
jgi:hypothetical protein